MPPQHSPRFSLARLLRLLTVVFVCALCPPAAAHRPIPQPSGSVIRGRIAMDDGAVPPSCMIVLTNTANRQQRRIFADTVGRFRFDHVPPGNYAVRACEGKSLGFRVEVVRVDKDGSEKSVILHEGSDAGGAVGRTRRASVPCLSVTTENSPLAVKPGEPAYANVVIQNNCKRMGVFGLRVESPAGTSAVTYDDSNFDGKHQPEEPAVSTTRQLSPRGGKQQLLLRISIPDTAWVEQNMKYVLSVRSREVRRANGHADVIVLKQTP